MCCDSNRKQEGTAEEDITTALELQQCSINEQINTVRLYDV
jgi:hypothetical protein